MLIITHIEVKIFFFFSPFLLCFIHKKLLVSLFFMLFYTSLIPFRHIFQYLSTFQEYIHYSSIIYKRFPIAIYNIPHPQKQIKQKTNLPHKIIKLLRNAV